MTEEDIHEYLSTHPELRIHKDWVYKPELIKNELMDKGISGYEISEPTFYGQYFEDEVYQLKAIMNWCCSLKNISIIFKRTGEDTFNGLRFYTTADRTVHWIELKQVNIEENSKNNKKYLISKDGKLFSTKISNASLFMDRLTELSNGPLQVYITKFTPLFSSTNTYDNPEYFKAQVNYNYVYINKHVYRIDILVANVYVDNPKHYTHVKHINNDYRDDNAANLVWVKDPARKPREKKYTEDARYPRMRDKIILLNEKYETIKIYESTEEASRETGITRRRIDYAIQHELQINGRLFKKIKAKYMVYNSNDPTNMIYESYKLIDVAKKLNLTQSQIVTAIARSYPTHGYIIRKEYQ